MSKSATSLVYGVGVNDAESTTRFMAEGRLTHCPYYHRWCSMLMRCYSAKYQLKNPSYSGCSVCTEWLVFSNFRDWMITRDWQGNDLDKDLLSRGNKIYSPQTCIFVPRAVNCFMNERGKLRGQYPLGVYFNPKINRFVSQCFSVVTGRQRKLGTHRSPEDAHRTWAEFKLKQAEILAARQHDARIAKALIERYTAYKLEAA